MKKSPLILFAAVLVFLIGYFTVLIDDKKSGVSNDVQYEVFSDSELGIEFKYRLGPDGYVLEEMMPFGENDGFIKTLILFRTEDKLRGMPVNGEGPPVMAIHIFNNLKKQSPLSWAESNIQYSNINLKIGEVLEASVDGARAIRYMADGLYASENTVVTHGDSAYVITGQFLDQNSAIRRDFEPLLDSVHFIPKPGQE
jgi:hypothetical protein